MDKSDIVNDDGFTKRQKNKIARAKKKADNSPEAVLAEFKEHVSPLNEKFNAACVKYGDRMKATLEDVAEMGKEIDTLFKGRNEKLSLAKLWEEAGFTFSYQTAINYRNVALNLDKVLTNREKYLLADPGSEYSLADAYEIARPTRRKKKAVEGTDSTEKPKVKKRAVLIVISDNEDKIHELASLVEGEGVEKIAFFAEQTPDAAKSAPFIAAVNAYATQ